MNYVLNNERYKGDALLQKQITTLTLPFKKQRNHGEQPNTVSFDKEAIKQKMLTCVSEKYTSLGTEEITAQSLKDIFKTVPPLTAYDSDLTDQAVSEIQLKGNGTISLVLINGQRIGKEKSA